MNNSENVTITTANPAPLGLLGFGLTTILLNLHNVGLYGLNMAIISMGIFIGGMAQVIAGVMEFKKNNTFGATAFTAYGFFWMTLVGIWLLPRFTVFADLKASEESMGWFLLLWGIFTSIMFVGTFRLNRALQVVFGTLLVLFYLLAVRDFSGNPAFGIIGGYVGILCGASSFYLSGAQVLNEVYGREVLPIGAK